jgi:hypothetical protein
MILSRKSSPAPLSMSVDHEKGETPASTVDLDRIWRAYIRRFDVEHTIRFAKQTLGATTPKIRMPEQADRWTWLILAALTQLRLARPLVADHRLPWQPPLAADKMTPGRVRAGFAQLLPRLNNPANWPKPSRPGPGRPKGRKSTPATRHPAAKKTNTKIHQQAKRRSGGPGESHPRAPTERSVTVSRHSALLIESTRNRVPTPSA